MEDEIISEMREWEREGFLTLPEGFDVEVWIKNDYLGLKTLCIEVYPPVSYSVHKWNLYPYGIGLE